VLVRRTVPVGDESGSIAWRGLDLAEIAHLSLSAALRDGHGVLGLGRIKVDVSHAMVVNGPSSLA